MNDHNMTDLWMNGHRLDSKSQKRTVLLWKLEVALFIWNISLKCCYVAFTTNVWFLRSTRKERWDKYKLSQLPHRAVLQFPHSWWELSAWRWGGHSLNIFFGEGDRSNRESGVRPLSGFLFHYCSKASSLLLGSPPEPHPFVLESFPLVHISQRVWYSEFTHGDNTAMCFFTY